MCELNENISANKSAIYQPERGWAWLADSLAEAGCRIVTDIHVNFTDIYDSFS